MPDTVRIPVVQDRGPAGLPAAVFSHWQHDQYRCYLCHPGIFSWRKQGFTHDDMAAGAFCGSCHNGMAAWHFEDRNKGCVACHLGSASTKPPPDNGFGDLEDLFNE